MNTPNIDRLAVDGLMSTGAVAGCPLCCPARGSLLTGLYAHNCVPGHEYQMPPKQETIAHVFRAGGYYTAWFGKWHLDGFKEGKERAGKHIIPPERRGGFDDWVGYENNNAQWDCWVHGHNRGQEVPQYRLPGFETDAMTDLFIDHLKTRANAGSPFFAALSVQPPHDPYVAPAEQMGRHNPMTLQLRANVPPISSVIETARQDLAGYYAMIENLDANVGRIIDTLAENGLSDNTHIIFFSDHGDMHGSHGQFRKTSPWEESVRVPFIISGGSRYEFKTGRKPLLVNQVDVAPTTLGLCGIQTPAWMQGTDYSSHRLPGAIITEGPDSAFLQLVIPTKHHNSTNRPWRAVITRDGWKYVCFEGIPWMMFNLNDDPYEMMDLAHNSRHEDQRKRLHQRLARWIDETGDKFVLGTC